MFRNLPFLFSLIFALSATQALAQDSTATEEAATSEEASTIGADAGQGLSLGEDDSNIGQPYFAEEIGDWKLQCIRSEDGNDPCQLYQLLNDAEGNPTAEISVFRLPADGQAVAGATVIVPLETLLTENIRIAVDSGIGKRYPYSFCNPIGCYARIGFTQADLDAYKRGAKATLTIVPFLAPDQKVEVTISLNGFTAGLEKATVLNQ